MRGQAKPRRRPSTRNCQPLTARGNHTHRAWAGEFERPEMAAKLRPMCLPANEQVLDRLEALPARGS